MEELRYYLLILVNLVLIESLCAIAPSWALGTFVSKLSKSNNKKAFIFVFVSFQLSKIILFFFFYFFPWKWMILLSLLVSLVAFIPFKKEPGKNILYGLLFLMAEAIVFMDQPFMGYYDSIMYPFNFTTNWYLIGLGYLAGVVVFWVVLSWSLKKSLTNNLVKWGGYFMLVLIILDSLFSDFLSPYVLNPESYEDREMISTVRVYLNYLLMGIVGFILLKFFIHRRKIISQGKSSL